MRPLQNARAQASLPLQQKRPTTELLYAKPPRGDLHHQGFKLDTLIRGFPGAKNE